MTSIAPDPGRPTAPGAMIVLLSSAAFFGGAALRICDALIPRLARDFGLTAGAAGRVVTGFAIGYGLMQLVFGTLVQCSTLSAT